jgi:hypothetical protein
MATRERKWRVRRANINPLPKQYEVAGLVGLGPSQFAKLARETGMQPVQVPPMTFSAQALADALSRYGPLWAAGDWNGGGHIIVITGVDSSGTPWINDPAFIQPQERNVIWLNQHICTTDGVPAGMMYLP